MDENGDYAFATLNTAKFERAVWQRRAGTDVPGNRWKDLHTSGQTLACDAQGCLYHLNGGVVAFAVTEDAQMEDCALADVTVVKQPTAFCQGTNHLITQNDLVQKGTHAIWLGPGGTVHQIKTVNGVRGDRPWVVGVALKP